MKRPMYESSEFYSLRQGEFVYFHGRVERFRFRYNPPAAEQLPKIRDLSASQLRDVAGQIRRDAAAFMNRFTNQ